MQTHEEAIASMLANISPISYKQLPLCLYQIGVKFRDELKPRFGLLRSKEFLMKDLYSFDCNEEMAQNTYDAINIEAYEYLFKLLEIPFVKGLFYHKNIMKRVLVKMFVSLNF